MRSKFILVTMIALPIFYVLSCNRNSRPAKSDNVIFPESLTAFGLFKGPLHVLQPADGVMQYQLSSTLFTDYAEKLRLIKIPEGKKLKLSGNGLPEFPEGTVLAKTFFYHQAKTGKNGDLQVLETPVLILKNGKWAAGTYQWNKNQDSALYRADAADVAVVWKYHPHRPKGHEPQQGGYGG